MTCELGREFFWPIRALGNLHLCCLCFESLSYPDKIPDKKLDQTVGVSSTWERSFENQPRHEGMDSWSDCCIPAFACFLLGRLTCLDLKQKTNQNKKQSGCPCLLSWLFASLRSLQLLSLQALRVMVVVVVVLCWSCLSCSLAVLAFLPCVSHPAFSSCLSSALILDAVAVSGEFPCFIISI